VEAAALLGEGERAEGRRLFIGRDVDDRQLVVGPIREIAAMRGRDACIGVDLAVHHRRRRFVLRSEQADALGRHTQAQRGRVLHLIDDDAEHRRGIAREGAIAGESSGIAGADQQAVVQGPDRPTEGDARAALLGDEQARGHGPAPLSQARQQLRELGLDRQERAGAGDHRDSLRQFDVAPADGSIAAAKAEGRLLEIGKDETLTPSRRSAGGSRWGQRHDDAAEPLRRLQSYFVPNRRSPASPRPGTM